MLCRVRTLCVVVGLAAAPSLAQPVVLLFPAVGTTSQVTVSGRVLKNGPSGGSSTVSKNLRRLTTSNWEGASVEVRFEGQQAQVTSGHDGNFEATFSAQKTPFPVGLTTVEAQVKGAEPVGAGQPARTRRRCKVRREIPRHVAAASRWSDTAEAARAYATSGRHPCER
jgi:hypothetical protein